MGETKKKPSQAPSAAKKQLPAIGLMMLAVIALQVGLQPVLSSKFITREVVRISFPKAGTRGSPNGRAARARNAAGPSLPPVRPHPPSLLRRLVRPFPLFSRRTVSTVSCEQTTPPPGVLPALTSPYPRRTFLEISRRISDRSSSASSSGKSSSVSSPSPLLGSGAKGAASRCARSRSPASPPPCTWCRTSRCRSPTRSWCDTTNSRAPTSLRHLAPSAAGCGKPRSPADEARRPPARRARAGRGHFQLPQPNENRRMRGVSLPCYGAGADPTAARGARGVVFRLSRRACFPLSSPRDTRQEGRLGKPAHFLFVSPTPCCPPASGARSPQRRRGHCAVAAAGARRHRPRRPAAVPDGRDGAQGAACRARPLSARPLVCGPAATDGKRRAPPARRASWGRCYRGSGRPSRRCFCRGSGGATRTSSPWKWRAAASRPSVC